VERRPAALGRRHLGGHRRPRLAWQHPCRQFPSQGQEKDAKPNPRSPMPLVCVLNSTSMSTNQGLCPGHAGGTGRERLSPTHTCVVDHGWTGKVPFGLGVTTSTKRWGGARSRGSLNCVAGKPDTRQGARGHGLCACSTTSMGMAGTIHKASGSGKCYNPTRRAPECGRSATTAPWHGPGATRRALYQES